MPIQEKILPSTPTLANVLFERPESLVPILEATGARPFDHLCQVLSSFGQTEKEGEWTGPELDTWQAEELEATYRKLAEETIAHWITFEKRLQRRQLNLVQTPIVQAFYADTMNQLAKMSSVRESRWSHKLPLPNAFEVEMMAEAAQLASTPEAATPSNDPSLRTPSSATLPVYA